jgi:DNA polymerase I-like protein with 3'-5' exonuclease and polymerase domains/uracil-DNA glycosylase
MFGGDDFNHLPEQDNVIDLFSNVESETDAPPPEVFDIFSRPDLIPDAPKKVATKRPRTPEEAHEDAMRRGALCKECPLFGCRRGPVKGQVVKNTRLTIIGEAPGKQEVLEQRVFTGPSGQELNEALQLGGADREDVTIINTIECQPPEEMTAYLKRLNFDHQRACDAADRAGLPHPPKPKTPIECCAPRLEREIKESNAETVLAVGGKALQALAGYYNVPFGPGKKERDEVRVLSIMNQHGSPVRLPNGHILCSSLHPAFALRGSRHYKYVIREDIARAVRIANRGNKLDWSEPEPILFPNIETVEKICAMMVEQRAPVTVDIETNSADAQTCHIRCVGLGATLRTFDDTLQEIVIVVPFRRIDKQPYWPDNETKMRAAVAVRSVLDNCPIRAHNGLFDTLVLLRFGLMSDRAKTWFDTMIAHHDTEANDLPHGLGFVGTRFFEVIMWKGDVDHKAANAEGDENLYRYNGKDIVVTHRLADKLRERINACATWQQFTTDTNLAPIARDMGDLGLVVDESERGRLSKLFNEKCVELRKKFRNIVGVPKINPGSPPQLRDWFFGVKGLRPSLNPQGFEWDEGDDPSTSSGALLRLQDNGVDRQTDQAIECLLEYRAYDKLRGTYIDRLKARDVDWNALGFSDDLIGRAPAVYRPPEYDFDSGYDQDLELVLAERPGYSLLNTTYKLHVIPTGRWATEPAVQNWPALGKGNMRKMIVAPPGHVIVGADYAQIEARLYAVLAGDVKLLDAFAKKLDAHSMNAASLFAESEDRIPWWYEYIEHNPDKKIRKHLRTIAKRFCFLEIYGGERDKLYSVMSADRDKATGKRTFPDLKPSMVEMWHDRWHTYHPETKQWHERCKSAERRHTFVATIIDHRKRFFPGGPNKANAVPNMTIQGSAASIMNQAILKIAEKIPFRSWSPMTGLFLQVHDFVGAYVPESRAEEAMKIIEDCMYWEHEGMPFVAEAEAKKCWGDMS